jgi:hypothetical protein
MKLRQSLTTIVSALTVLAGSAALAQDSPPTFQGDPSVYKIIFEDQNFRVIEATWAKGVHDKPHSHPVPSVIYSLNDCMIRAHAPDGKTRDIPNKAGTAMTVPITPSHTAENIGASDCRAIFVERK